MSSLEIAEITGKEHRNVLRDIKAILGEAGIDALKFERIYLDARNREKPCYLLPRFECDLVVSGYSVKYRAAIIRRWHELEAKEAATAEVRPLTLRESLQLNLDLLTQNEEKDRLLEAQKPDVEFVEKYVKTTGLHGVRKTAKSLGQNRWQPNRRFRRVRWLPETRTSFLLLLDLQKQAASRSFGRSWELGPGRMLRYARICRDLDSLRPPAAVSPSGASARRACARRST